MPNASALSRRWSRSTTHIVKTISLNGEPSFFKTRLRFSKLQYMFRTSRSNETSTWRLQKKDTRSRERDDRNKFGEFQNQVHVQSIWSKNFQRRCTYSIGKTRQGMEEGRTERDKERLAASYNSYRKLQSISNNDHYRALERERW